MSEGANEGTVRVAVTLSETDAAKLRASAGAAGIGPGLLSRALVRYGLDHLDDPGIQAVIEAVTTADRERRAETGRRAMQIRHHGGEQPPDKG